MDDVSFDKLKSRMGETYFGKRMRLQAHHFAIRLEGGGHIYWENIELIPRLLRLLLKYSGLLRRAERNTLEFDVVEIPVPLKRLPEAFDGYRILHLSDLTEIRVSAVEPSQSPSHVYHGNIMVGSFLEREESGSI